MDNLKNKITELYGNKTETIEYQLNRYTQLIDRFNNNFGKKTFKLFSTPGRTELSGNHTDHNNGKVLAASINLDSIAAASENNSDIVKIHSEGFDEQFVVDLNNLGVDEGELETTNSLIRGIAARLKMLGYSIGGFDCCITSNVLQGSGLSSSASIEVLIGTVFNYLFNDGKISSVEIAKISQYAENKYFGKPCGLMDQMACAVGGITSINFKDVEKPDITKMEFSFSDYGYSAFIVNSGGHHADLTPDYASIPIEMKKVAAEFNTDVLEGISKEKIFSKFNSLREKLGDRPVLRALHFIDENERVEKQINSLKEKRIEDFINLVRASGDSSFKWLQNIYSSADVNEQPITLALALTEEFLDSNNLKGAARIHGGGFAGTILSFIPEEFGEEYILWMENIFGKNSVSALSIRNAGTCLLF